MSKKDKSRRNKKKDKRKFQSSKLKERLKKGQERSSGRQKNIFSEGQDIATWRPKDGSHIIDIIPYYAGKYDSIVGEGDPTYSYEYWVHKNVGPNDSWYLCNTEMFNKPCPICEHRQKLREDGADEEVWKKLFPKRRNLYNVMCFDRGEEDKGVRVWDASFHYFEKHVMALSKKPGRGGKADKSIDFADPYEGKSINFTIEPAKGKDDFPKFLGHAFDDRDYEIDDDILDDAVILDEITHRPTYDEVSLAYWGESGPDKKREKKKRDVDEDEPDNKLEELVDEVDDMDDMDDLEDFIEEHDLDVKIKKKDDEDDVKEKIGKALAEKYPEKDDDDDSDDDDITKKDIKKMDFQDLDDLIDDKDLDIDIDNFDDDDDDDLKKLRKEVIQELDL